MNTKEILKNNASKKQTMHKHHRRPIEDLGFSPWRKSEFTTMPSARLLPATTNEGHNLNFHPGKSRIGTQ
jgi:hypothetical protein